MTDPDLEALIDRAGRERVFARVQDLGWSSSLAPPVYVWRQVAYALIRERELERKLSAAAKEAGGG